MFKFMLGVIFTLVVLYPSVAKNILFKTVDTAHVVSNVAIKEGARLADESVVAVQETAEKTSVR